MPFISAGLWLELFADQFISIFQTAVGIIGAVRMRFVTV
jgi:hypothetical protein